ncbi:chaperonin GroL [Candidatus Adlerbacteria bacterium RIFCSPHIGHO2_02_FULL_54_18]|uniref:Chaperonin GroEL n=1 Tax=Candidatus Adlerbacteria bacterium RIFCSPHIGHO2_02_FULL_54_18 TaxID=1797241 RepID=A0A1F4Y454_9BACT|nr:MAG: chaperonin GroL [Candidatus Adlerbacteria bacterium RIFCSPHIGHO2_02_FULL_54_18]
MAKHILFNERARRALKSGIDKASNTVKITLGPRGRNVALDRGYGGPTITNDGVSIAKEISFKDKFENMGAEIVKEVASKTNDIAGDGTTTSVVLLQALIEEGMKHTEAGLSAMAVRHGIESATAEAVVALRSLAKKIGNDEEVLHVATISAESEEIGAIIADTIKEVGKDGVVTVEESQSLGIEKEVVEGLEFDRGYVSAYMVTDPGRMEAVYKDPAILITDKKISSVAEVLPILQKVAESGKKDLVIIAEDVDGEALTTFVLNKLRGTFNVLAVKAPGYGDRKKEMLQDIAAMTGGQVISEEVGVKFENAVLEMLGRAQKVIATKDSTVIVGGKGPKKDIDARIAQLRKQIEDTTSKFDKEKLEERLAKLSGGVAIIRVGAATETEMKYLKLKIEDAVNATKAAIEEGIVAGGGVALVKAAQKVAEGFEKKKDKMDIAARVGYEVVLRALEMPLRQIAQNAGTDAGVVVEKVKQAKGNAGYDAVKNEIVPDMMVAGIVDPVKVTRTGLERAASAAAMLLTTEAAVAEEPKEEKDAPMPGGGMGDMDY